MKLPVNIESKIPIAKYAVEALTNYTRNCEDFSKKGGCDKRCPNVEVFAASCVVCERLKIFCMTSPGNFRIWS